MLTIAVSSCGEKTPDDNKVDEPKFPSQNSYTVKPGESATLSFTASYDWDLSIPTTMSQYF